MRFCILGSGSSGNSALLQTAGAQILIDAGLSARRLGERLAAVGTSLEQVDAVFLTHEHGDHCAGIDGLRKYPHLRLYANAPTARAIQGKLKHRPHWVPFETGSRFAYRDLSVTSFSVPHDAQDPVGFRFESAEGRALVLLTDLGYAPPNVRAQLAAADILVIEANHCTDLLKADPKRPWSLKQRISGRHGHLSNAATAEILAATLSPRWRHIYLAHQSRDCNSPAAIDRAFAAVRPLLAPHCALTVVAPDTPTPLLDLGELQSALPASAPLLTASAPSAAASASPASADADDVSLLTLSFS